MKFPIILGYLFLVAGCGAGTTTSQIAANDAAATDPIESCENSNNAANAYSFAIREGVEAGTYAGVLTTNGRVVSMTCERDKKASPGGYDMPAGLWNCVENRGGDGLYRVWLHTQGFTALKLADVTIDQMFPLKPKYVTTLVCKR